MISDQWVQRPFNICFQIQFLPHLKSSSTLKSCTGLKSLSKAAFINLKIMCLYKRLCQTLAGKAAGEKMRIVQWNQIDKYRDKSHSYELSSSTLILKKSQQQDKQSKNLKIPWLPYFKYVWTATFGWNKRPLAEFMTCATVWACVWWAELSNVTLPQQLSQRSSATQSVSCLSNTPLIIQRERGRDCGLHWSATQNKLERAREM